MGLPRKPPRRPGDVGSSEKKELDEQMTGTKKTCWSVFHNHHGFHIRDAMMTII